MTEHHADEAKEHEGIDKSPLSPFAFRVMAIRDLLVERGLVTEEEIDAAAREMESRTPARGARLIARAWVDPDFKERLLEDAHAAAAELGMTLPPEPRITVLENTPEQHHVVVCTLCSCYPRALLGRPPDWYKSLNYRSRVVREPREVLDEFGLELAGDAAVEVVDSTADLRYLVLPVRPTGTEGFSEERLAELITRNSMIGTGVVTLDPTA
jgi:nitrile hydratase subunit alpha